MLGGASLRGKRRFRASARECSREKVRGVTTLGGGTENRGGKNVAKFYRNGGVSPRCTRWKKHKREPLSCISPFENSIST